MPEVSSWDVISDPGPGEVVPAVDFPSIGRPEAVTVEPTPRMRPGHIALTAAEDRDQWAGTPWHKHVPAKIEVM